jgi:lipopolysaccharide/colanic/teichoic acid biosynthesis glycosyltransferase
VGKDHREFTLYKLRTMRVGAESATGPVWAQGDNDPRVTAIGRLLRRTHLDELPQLVNVLKGEMSLVGPRPERPYFVKQLMQQIPDYERRLSVKPGITGLAQVRAGADRNIRDVKRKVKLDCLYIRRMCWWVDFVILFNTVRKVFAAPEERRGLGAQRRLTRGTV